MKNGTNVPLNVFIISVLLIFLMTPAAAAADDLAAVASVEKSDVFLGEDFIYQISVKGSNSPEQPQLSGISGFDVSYLGGADQSNSFTIIINGEKTVNESKAYIFQYRLTPRQTGTLTIPSVMVRAEGKNLATSPIVIRVSKPEEVADYKFRLRFSKTSCYIGDSITVTAVWYFAKNVQDPSFNVPLFEDNHFRVVTPEIKREPGKEYLQLRVGSEQVVTEYSENGSLDGRKYNTITFKKILIPRLPGRVTVPQASVTFNGVYEYRRVRDFWGTREQPLFRRFSIPSNTATLSLLPLPEATKPLYFSGLVGTYSLSARAAPTDVRVGDPITVALTLKGDGYLEEADLPPLHEIPELAGDFKIPEDMSPGEIRDGGKVFTQTFRAKHEHITAIPEISIPFFNPKSGKYDYMTTKPIPISVRPAANELTVLDLEGRDPLELQRILEVWEEGIAHNYEGDDVLGTSMANLIAFIGNPFIFLVMVLPFAAYLVLLFIFRIRPVLLGDRQTLMVKNTLISLKKAVEGVRAAGTPDASFAEKIMECLKAYLAAKTGHKAASLTYNDIVEPLLRHGVSGKAMETLKKVFDACEASHYAGGAFLPEDIKQLADQTEASAEEIERSYA
ncbi:MAG: BatD family protein [Spirochaetales bacterium]|nr:BatD family protein [Spirochaetales bacterium]